MIHFSRLLYKISFNTQFHSQAVVILKYSEQVLLNLLNMCNNLALKPGEEKPTELNSYLLGLTQVAQRECGKPFTFDSFGVGSNDQTLGEMSKKNTIIKNIV